ncbi:FG-GAP-like repeat-containing protein [Streptomyces sp. NRRL B-1347]|uniref:FG-GAP-like repeat-containing protein n=1 Tax=Streptomyces sp. NRRL B-1347 TaxID=1476877 RepID=UPI0004CB45DF|nr:FG-GAP-like repeat-containing protein [Streptomyces sp. NRRL B-1347]
MRHRALTAAGLCAAVVLGAVGLAPVASADAPEKAPGGARPAVEGPDFNGDGFPDLAVGAHTATVDGVKRAGAVTVAYGSAHGLTYDTAQVLGQGSPGVPGEPVPDARWREVSDYGDLDGDGYDDLVVHWLQKNTVLWGSEDGITGAGTALPPGDYRADSPKLLGGGAGVGDVNGDGVDDFVSRGHNGLSYGVSVLLGPLNRETGKPAGIWHRDSAKADKLVIGTVYVGDLTGDGIDDVVASGGVVLGSGKPGGVVLKGSKDGLVKGSAFKAPYRHGTVLPSAFGDLNKDGYQDLVTGHPDQNKVYVTYGGPDGTSATLKSRSYSQASAGVPGVDEAGDKFGSAVAVGDTDADGYADLVVGASYETGSDPVATAKAGAVTVLRGGPSGITTEGARTLTQNSKGVPSTSEADDHFGAAVAVTGAGGRPEVLVGGNGEDGFKGRVWRLPTGADGVTGTGSTSFRLDALGGPAGGGNFGYRMVG